MYKLIQGLKCLLKVLSAGKLLLLKIKFKNCAPRDHIEILSSVRAYRNKHVDTYTFYL